MSYTHISPMERAQIELLHEQGHSPTAIASRLGRHRTSVSRELGRNSTRTGYDAAAAQSRYAKRRKACRPRSRLSNEVLRDYVIDKIAMHRWSPEVVAGRWARRVAGGPEKRVCHETIYQAIYANRHYLDFLVEYLPQARPKRRKRGQGKTRRGPLIPDRISIHERPEAVAQRVEHGHWEGDLVVGKGQDGFILTLVERVSRLCIAVKTRTKQAAEVGRAVVDALLDFPTSWVKTITFDNGTEFYEHKTMTQHLGAPVYFADPYAAYQRGSNEQVNGLIRRYLPKGTPFATLSQDRLETIIEEINDRPRKCLGYRSPNEVFRKQRKEHLRALGA